MREIERKFLVKELPNLNNIEPIRYERYFLDDSEDKQVRIQKKSNKFELETKTKINDTEYEKTKKDITENEFLELSQNCNKSIIRDSYLISDKPNITIKKYYNDYDGLIRAEIEYSNIEEIGVFILPDWIGIEITGTELGNDNKLIKLNRAEFLEALKKYKGD